ncbi:MAG TPA: FAD-dependent oxidoreductase [Dehalococcoidia bacterium]|nr:FAD-dependent oxidoreductase [Dehalococcoidia bacterium]
MTTPPSDPATNDVVICGGGVIGTAIAYYLGKRGVRSTIIEADAVASGASGAAAGLLSPPPLATTTEPPYELRVRGFEMHDELAETLPAESGVDYSFSRDRRVQLATTEEEERRLRDAADTARAAGRSIEWFDAAGVTQLCPWIDRPGRGGVVGEPVGQLDPYRYTLALVAAAEQMGATLRSGSVSGIAQADGRVAGVVVGGAVIPADVVVVAMGPWSIDAGSWLGFDVPVEPLKGQIVRVKPSDDLVPFGFGYDSNYVTTKEGGLVFIGTTEERAGFDVATTNEARDEILRFGMTFSSVLGEAELVEQTACLRPLSSDGLPIMGRVPGLAGAYLATGHGRQGILMSPPSGQAMADLIVDGATDCIDLAAFDPARFAS